MDGQREIKKRHEKPKGISPVVSGDPTTDRALWELFRVLDDIATGEATEADEGLDASEADDKEGGDASR